LRYMYGMFFKNFGLYFGPTALGSAIKSILNSLQVAFPFDKVSQFCAYFIPPNLNWNSVDQTCRRKHFNFFYRNTWKVMPNIIEKKTRRR
jgi:hypothetical protein